MNVREGTSDWLVIEVGAYKHAVPRDDIEEHRYSSQCSCRPDKDNKTMQITHNSFDGREAYEEGLREWH